MNGYRCYQPSTRGFIISHDVQIIETNGVILHKSTPLDLISGPPMPQVFSPVTLTPLPTSLSIVTSPDSMPIEPIKLESLPLTLSPSPLAHTHDVAIPTEPLAFRRSGRVV